MSSHRPPPSPTPTTPRPPPSPTPSSNRPPPSPTPALHRPPPSLSHRPPPSPTPSSHRPPPTPPALPQPLQLPRETSVTFSLPSPGAHTPQTPLPRRASRAPRKPSRRPPTPTAPTPNVQLKNLLESIGYGQYIERLSKANLRADTLYKLSNAELRDDLQIEPLRHRRELQRVLRTLQPGSQNVKETSSVPEFGRILVHLSNVRTFHSWLSTGVQAVVFASAILRLSPGLRPAAVTRPIGLALVAVGGLLTLYGVFRYWRVLRWANLGGREFEPDQWGTAGLVLITLCVAAGCVYVVLRDGFWAT